MKRFNLLLVNQDAGLGHAALSVLSKIYRSNFVFELNNVVEAEKMLGKLHIDCLVVNLDDFKLDFIQLSKQFPSMLIVGVSKSPKDLSIAFDPDKHVIFSKAEFSAGLQSELKALRKPSAQAKQIRRQFSAPAPASADDFRDFSKLVAAH